MYAVHCQHCFCIDFTCFGSLNIRAVNIPKHDSWTIIGHLNVSFSRISAGFLLDRMFGSKLRARSCDVADSLYCTIYLAKTTPDFPPSKLAASLIKTFGVQKSPLTRSLFPDQNLGGFTCDWEKVKKLHGGP